MSEDTGSPLLQLVRERVAAGREAEYDDVERAIAAACRQLGGPHPYLALRNVEDPRDVWWLNRFESAPHRQQVVDAYAGNAALMNEMGRLAARKGPCVEATTDLLLRSCGPDHHAHAAIGTTPFVAASWSAAASPSGAWAFDAAGGARLLLVLAASASDARAEATRLGPDAIVLAVVPAWSLPAT